MKGTVIKQILMLFLVFGIAIVITITDIAGQTGDWEFFEEVVFELVNDVVQSALQGNMTTQERVSFKEGVAELETLFVTHIQQGQCSPQACESISHIIQATRNILDSASDGGLSVEGQREIAFLRQAVHNHYSGQQTQTAQPSGVQHPSQSQFSLGYAYRSGGKGDFQIFQEAGVMYSGDHYKILFTPSEDCYVYIFQVDSSNMIYGLFPLQNFRGVQLNLSNPVRAGHNYFVPAQDKSFVLDQQTGTEQIYFLVLQQPDPELERQYQEVLQTQNQNETKHMQLAQAKLINRMNTTKGPAIVVADQAGPESVSWQEDGQTFSLLQQRLVGNCEECLHVLTFTHK